MKIKIITAIKIGKISILNKFEGGLGWQNVINSNSIIYDLKKVIQSNIVGICRYILRSCQIVLNSLFLLLFLNVV